MKLDKAVKFCEEHECKECPVYINDIELRAGIEQHDMPCCINLVRMEDYGREKED